MAGEIVKARNTLAGLRQEIGDASRDLGPLRQENAELTTANEKLRLEQDSLLGDMKSLLLKIGAAEEELKTILGKISEAEKRYRRLEELSRETSTALRTATEDLRTTNGKVARARQLLADLDRDAEKETERAGQIRIELEGLEAQSLGLEKEVRESKRKLKAFEGKKAVVLVAIDDAIEDFRIFERRISKFSEETGYLVGYSDPALLLNE